MFGADISFCLKILVLYKEFGVHDDLFGREFLNCRNVCIFDDHLCFDQFDKYIDDVRQIRIETSKIAAMKVLSME